MNDGLDPILSPRRRILRRVRRPAGEIAAAYGAGEPAIIPVPQDSPGWRGSASPVGMKWCEALSVLPSLARGWRCADP
jgi:hypothetical protein